ncbi:hypothetical protein [Limnohabitans sp. DM1]|uniref:hypothetical protein n=1 Tax=Limnohabitans sp. DM1 TaxID=1597955 RepID=UPI000B1DDD57|nr:hypothetical protein [Limnohabitans sp. DM1]
MTNQSTPLVSTDYAALRSNIKRMLAFYREYPHLEFVPQAAAQIEPGPKGPQTVALFTAELNQW